MAKSIVKRFSIAFQRKRKAAAPKGTSWCPTCNKYKDISEFSRLKKTYNGLDYYCKQCKKAYNESRRENRASSDRKRNYGISDEEYQALKIAQGGVCAICGQSEIRIHKGAQMDLCVDHDHETGEVRGLLCWHCNAGLGHFRDDPQNLSAAIDYLMGLHR